MMTEIAKTLEVKLVDPNAHKERKLRETREEYQRALKDAFDQRCTTPTAANDVVVDYDLSGYAKNALKQYVPQLCGGSYDAKELASGHPVKFTNQGFKLDHKPQNAVEWYVKIPHHEDYHLWLPASINPDQREWFEALYADSAQAGEFRLLDRDGEWYLHITATRDVRQQTHAESIDETPVRVDIGEAALATVCHRNEHGTPTAPEVWNTEGKTVRELRERYFTAKKRLQERGSERIADDYGDELWRRIDEIVHTVTREIVEYADRVEGAVLVLEDLTYIRESMDYGSYMNRRLHGWAFAKIHSQICYKAEERGIPVETINPRNTSKMCHACGEVGSRSVQAEFHCTNAECWVSKYQADINAALNIADRYLAGESQPRTHPDSGQKAVGDDSGEDGASLTGPQDSRADAETQQTTLGTYAS